MILRLLAKHVVAPIIHRVAGQVGEALGARVGQRINPEGYVALSELTEVEPEGCDDEPDEPDDEEDESPAPSA